MKNKQPQLNDNMYEDLFKDGKFEMDLDKKYASFLVHFFYNTGLRLNEEKILSPNEYYISFAWFIMQVAKLYDSWLQKIYEENEWGLLQVKKVGVNLPLSVTPPDRSIQIYGGEPKNLFHDGISNIMSQEPLELFNQSLSISQFEVSSNQLQLSPNHIVSNPWY